MTGQREWASIWPEALRTPQLTPSQLHPFRASVSAASWCHLTLWITTVSGLSPGTLPASENCTHHCTLGILKIYHKGEWLNILQMVGALWTEQGSRLYRKPLCMPWAFTAWESCFHGLYLSEIHRNAKGAGISRLTLITLTPPLCFRWLNRVVLPRIIRSSSL